MKKLLLALLLCASINKAGMPPQPAVMVVEPITTTPPMPPEVREDALNMCAPIIATLMTDAVIEFAWETAHQGQVSLQIDNFIALLHQDLLTFPEYVEATAAGADH